MSFTFLLGILLEGEGFGEDEIGNVHRHSRESATPVEMIGDLIDDLPRPIYLIGFDYDTLAQIAMTVADRKSIYAVRYMKWLKFRSLDTGIDHASSVVIDCSNFGLHSRADRCTLIAALYKHRAVKIVLCNTTNISFFLETAYFHEFFTGITIA